MRSNTTLGPAISLDNGAPRHARTRSPLTGNLGTSFFSTPADLALATCPNCGPTFSSSLPIHHEMMSTMLRTKRSVSENEGTSQISIRKGKFASIATRLILRERHSSRKYYRMQGQLPHFLCMEPDLFRLGRFRHWLVLHFIVDRRDVKFVVLIWFRGWTEFESVHSLLWFLWRGRPFREWRNGQRGCRYWRWIHIFSRTSSDYWLSPTKRCLCQTLGTIDLYWSQHHWLLRLRGR
jgi:hypothetical protein